MMRGKKESQLHRKLTQTGNETKKLETYRFWGGKPAKSGGDGEEKAKTRLSRVKGQYGGKWGGVSSYKDRETKSGGSCSLVAEGGGAKSYVKKFESSE